MPVQKLPAPTAAGIRSEPSKRNVSAFIRISAYPRWVSDGYQSSGTPFIGATTLPALTSASTDSGVIMNETTSRPAGLSFARLIRFPEPSTGRPNSGSIGGK